MNLFLSEYLVVPVCDGIAAGEEIVDMVATQAVSDLMFQKDLKNVLLCCATQTVSDFIIQKKNSNILGQVSKQKFHQTPRSYS